MGEGNSVLSGGTDMLLEIRDSLQTLEEYKSKSLALKTDEQNLEKEIEATEKNMNAEIASTVAKRKGEIEASYVDQVNSIQSTIKKERAKRDKEKNSKVSERIERETEDIKKEILARREDIKQVFSRRNIPMIFNTEYFFALYMPNGIKDLLAIVLSFLASVFIPTVVFCVILPDDLKKWWMALLLYGVITGGFFAIYLLIRAKVRRPYLDALKTAAGYRSRIKGGERRIKKIEKGIRKDSDESRYDLGEFDKRIDSLEEQLENVLEEKKKALVNFEDHTKYEISDDIRDRYSEKLNASKTKYEKIYNERCTTEKLINESTIKISKKYEAYVGKAALNITTIDRLIDMIEKGTAVNIADALDKYNKNMINE